MKHKLTLALLLFMAVTASAQLLSNGIVDTKRAADWTQAGVSGGIPSGSWAQCGSTITPFGDNGSGTVNTSGTSVTWVSGTQFKNSWTGASIWINGSLFTISTVPSNTSMTLTTSAGTHAGIPFFGAGSLSPAPINNAIAACAPNTFVMLAGGGFGLNACINMKAGVALRGSGANQTKLTFAGGCPGMDGSKIFAIGMNGFFHFFQDFPGPSGYDPSKQCAWTGTNGSAGVYTQGATVLNLACTPTAVVGDILDLVQNDDPNSAVPKDGYFVSACVSPNCTGPTGGGIAKDGSGSGSADGTGMRQNVVITNIAGGTVTVNPPILSDQWRTGQSPIAYWWGSSMHTTGIENLSIDTGPVNMYTVVSMFQCRDCWELGVASHELAARNHVVPYLSTRDTIMNNWFDGACVGGCLATFTGYQFELFGASSVLFQNNILTNGQSPMIPDVGSAGNVLGYNYSTLQQGTDSTNSINSHEEEFQYNLLEGNDANTYFSDFFHGTQHFTTLFRNRLHSAGYPTIDIASYNRWHSAVGNVLGDASSLIYDCFNSSNANCDRFHDTIFRTGYPGVGATVAPNTEFGIKPDAEVHAGLLRWGNYDTITGTVRWCGNSSDTGWATTCSSTSEVPTTDTWYANAVPSKGDTGAGQPVMPPSFYLTSKPSWFGSKPFPLTGPDVSGGNISGLAGHANTTPAQDCYNSTSGIQSSFNATTCYAGVSPIPTTTTLTSSLNPSQYGQTVTFTATVTPGGATGTVTFIDNITPIGTGTLSGGVATLSISTLIVGTHPITAVYAGDGTYSGSTSSPVSQVVNKAVTTTTITSSLNPSQSGQAVTFTASVTPANASGTITFMDGVNPLGTASLNAGTASLTISTLAIGTHSITAVYSGDSNYLGSTSPVLNQVVGLISTSTALTSSLNPSKFNDSVTFTATVTPPAATGTITFKDGATTLGVVTLVSGSAAFMISTLTVGTHSITAIYSGDSTYAGSTSPVLSQVVKRAKPNATGRGAPNPSKTGQQVILSADITPTNATGTVTFVLGSSTIGTGTISAGTASISTAVLPAGTNAIAATYNGDSRYDPAQAPAFNQVVTSSSPPLVLMGKAHVIGIATLAPPGNFLVSITVAPDTASIVIGSTQQFTAQGQYSDGSTQDFTALCGTGWASSDITKATITTGGLATGVGAGTTNITCTYGTVVSPPSVLTVTAAPVFSITTTSLPNGDVTHAYTSSIFSVNGLAPCSWNVTGSPIPGVTLASSSNPCSPVSFSGTPTTPGTYIFTVHGTDSGAHLASQDYTVTISGITPTCGPPHYVCSNSTTAITGTLDPNASYVFKQSDPVNTTRYDTTLNPVGTNCYTEITDESTFGGVLSSFTYDGGSGTDQASKNGNFITVANGGKSNLLKVDLTGPCAKVVYPTPGNKITEHTAQRSVFSQVTDSLIYQQSGTLAQSVTITGTPNPTSIAPPVTLFDYSQCPHTGGIGVAPASFTAWDIGGADLDIILGIAWTQLGECSGQGCAHDMYIFKQPTHQCATLYVKDPGDGTTSIDLYDWCDPDANGHTGDHANCATATPIQTTNYSTCLFNGAKGGFHGGKLSPDGTWFNGGIQCAGTGGTAAGILWHLGTGTSVTTDVRLSRSGLVTGHGKPGNTGETNANNPSIGFTPYGTVPTGWPNGTVTAAGPFTSFNGCEMHPGWVTDAWDAIWTVATCNNTNFGVLLTAPYQNELFGVDNLNAGSPIPRFGHTFATGPPSAPKASQTGSNFACMYTQVFLSQDGNWLFYSSPMLGQLGLTPQGYQNCRGFAVRLK